MPGAGKRKITPAAAKDKGRRFQKEIAAEIRELFADKLHEDDVGWCSMGSSGVDIELSPLAQTLVPFDFECKNVEKPNIWAVLQQAWDRDDPANKPDRIPAALLRKNRTKPVAVVPFGWIHDLLVRYHASEAPLIGERASLASICPPEKRHHSKSVTTWLQYCTDAGRSQQHTDVFDWMGYTWRSHRGKSFPFWKTVNEELGGEYLADGVLFNRDDEGHVIMAVVAWNLLKDLMAMRAAL